jgi:hypothetical protein
MKKLNKIKFINVNDFPSGSTFDYFDDPSFRFTEVDTTPDLRLNKNRFRCDEFLKESDKYIILSAGCSVTFGVGLREDEMWPTMLEKLIDDKDVHMYNISKPGWSAFEIVSNVFLYLRNFQKPKEIYILLPDEARTNGYSVVEKSHGTFVLVPGNEEDEQIMREEVMLSNAIHVKNYLFMLEEYCRVQNIKLFITTWNENNFINNNYSFSNSYYPYSVDSAKNFVKKYQEDHPNDEFIFFARDKSHQGTGHHAHWADMFYRARKESL